jgi:chromosome segregation ATPase
MFKLFKPKNPKNGFDWRVLKKNDISILILDERWNALFKNVEKTEDIKEHETKIKELLKEESRLIAQSKEIAAKKKKNLDKIIQLTPQVYEDSNEEAKEEMKRCELEVKQINERMKKITDELDNMPKRIREANLRLLESTVGSVYFRMRKHQKRLKELERLIETTKKQLEEYIDEKGRLSEDDTDVYTYFHDLLGGEELEKLDREYFGEE